MGRSHNTTSQRWMVVSYFTGVDGMAASIHADVRIRELISRSIDVRVISSMAARENTGLVRRVLSPLPTGIRFEIRHLFRKKRKTPLNRLLKSFLILLIFPAYAVEKIFLHFDPTWSWYLSASQAAVREAHEFHPDVVYSTGGPASAHLVAEAVKKASGARWIAEFQDPLLHPTTYRGRREKRHFEKVENSVAADADAAVYLTEGARNRAIRRADFSGRTSVIYPGAPAFKNAELFPAGDELVIAHIGTLHGTRNLDSLMEGIRLLRERDDEAASSISVLQYGHASAAVSSSTAPLAGQIQIRGRVNHDQALKKMAEAHVLLLIQNADDVSAETIPSKVYEYMQARRPILGLVYRNPELKDLLESSGHMAVEIEDPNSIAGALHILVKKFREDTLMKSSTDPRITLSSSVDRLLGLVNADA